MLGDLDGTDEFLAALDPPAGERTERLQAYIISGHNADFGIMAMDSDPLKIDSIYSSVVLKVSGKTNLLSCTDSVLVNESLPRIYSNTTGFPSVLVYS